MKVCISLAQQAARLSCGSVFVRGHLSAHYMGAYTDYKLCYLTRTGNQAFYWFPPPFEKKAAILQWNEALIFHTVLVFIVLLLVFLTAKNKIPKAWI